MSSNYYGNHRCSECGQEFFVTNYEYTYKISTSTEKSVRVMYQCCYTCYDHAKLRKCRQSFISDEKYQEYVTRCENSMRAKKLKILHPIKVKKND